MKKMNDCHCREYKILKAHWRLFHKDSADLEAARSVYLRGVNEYLTQQNVLDLIVKNHPQFEKVYDAYQDVSNALKEKKGEAHCCSGKLPSFGSEHGHSHLHLEEEHDSCS